MEFGDKLKELREEWSLTQEELAKELGIKRSSIAGYESKKVSLPELDTFIKIADYFKVSTDYLLGRTQNRIFEGGLQELMVRYPDIDEFVQKLLKDKNFLELTILASNLEIADVIKICNLIRIVFCD